MQRLDIISKEVVYMIKPRLRLLLYYQGYPRISQSYMIEEAKQLDKTYLLSIVSIEWPTLTCAKDVCSYKLYNSKTCALNDINEFKPEHIHGHFIGNSKHLRNLALEHKCKFSIKTHSFDVLQSDLSIYKDIINSDECSGIIIFPCLLDKFINCGYNKNKLFPSYPAINIKRFQLHYTPPYPDPTLKAIMSGGALLKKKNIKSYIDLAFTIKQLYPNVILTYYTVPEDPPYYKSVSDYNLTKGSPVTFVFNIEPCNMPAEYKKHQWLVYMACPVLKTVGYPIMVAEAQACGVGVILHSSCADPEDYLAGTGFIIDTHEQILDILSRPFPQDMSRRAFALSDRYDIEATAGVILNKCLSS